MVVLLGTSGCFTFLLKMQESQAVQTLYKHKMNKVLISPVTDIAFLVH